MPPADRTAWARLGRLLAERRVQISPRYANRRAFAADREMNWRTLHDVEAAKRTNFTPQTMRAFEAAYMLAPGSLERTLAGGELEPLPTQPPAPKLAVAPSLPPAGRLAEWLTSLPDEDIERVVAHDPLLRQVWDLQDGTGKPADRAQRIAMLVVVLTPIDPMAMVAERREGSAGLEPGNPPVKGK